MGRFLSPDLLGGHLENPQSLNKYVYALNNPLTNTDPTGLDSYLQCTSTADNASTCQSQTVGYDSKGNAQMATVQGVTGQNGQFTATQIGNDANGNLVDKTTGTGSYTASVNGSGVQFSNNGGQSYSSGVFVNGTPQTTFQDAGFANGGALSGFNFTLTNSKLEANQTEPGYFSFGGTPARAGAALQQAGFNPRYGTEGGNEYRSPGSGLTGANSGHFIVNPNILLDPGVTLPVAGGGVSWGFVGFRGQTGRSLCGTMSALRFECEFRLASIRNDLFSGSALLWCQAPLGCLLQAMDEFGTSPWSTGVRALAYDGKLRFQLPCGEVLAPRPSGPMGAPPLQR